MKSAKKSARRSNAYHHGDLKSSLLTAAGKLLERDGPEAISLRAVARASGVSQTAPYNHFPDKEHLLVALAAGGFHRLETVQVAAANSTNESGKKILAIGCAYVAFACAHPQLYRLMFGVGIADWRAYPEVEQVKQASYIPVQQALAAYLSDQSFNDSSALETTNVAAWALVHGLSMLLIDGALTSEKPTAKETQRMIEQVIERFVGGLK